MLQHNVQLFNLSLIIEFQSLSCLVYHTTKYMIPGPWVGCSQDWESREGQGHNKKTLECLTRLSDSLHFSRLPFGY